MKSRLILLLMMMFICVFAVNAQSGRKSKQNPERQEPTETKKEPENRPLKIIKKYPPSPKVFGRCAKEQGVSYLQIRVRVTFADTGVISDVEVMNPSGCYRFDEESVRVAYLIKFEPEIKDGKAQTVAKIVVYDGGIR